MHCSKEKHYSSFNKIIFKVVLADVLLKANYTHKTTYFRTNKDVN